MIIREIGTESKDFAFGLGDSDLIVGAPIG